MKQYINWKVVGYVAGAILLIGLAWHFLKKPKLTPEEQKKKDDEAKAKAKAKEDAEKAKGNQSPKMAAPFKGFMMTQN